VALIGTDISEDRVASIFRVHEWRAGYRAKLYALVEAQTGSSQLATRAP
jgi:hypothetical protein